ncbi:MAG: NADH-quinone oxidoreductase subunit D [Planctomycetota bacterium]|nr:MAG: NADH-quinone oxidoreductase subunit D [Planctomycetota bacterium]REJ88639.1 MAG: NADH-quinone oxidoreductase subunit D [Planctomycetota bacterium]REK27211.1 MAG: NADH-quinone oxidoreductase subunit D [Planctomycetota bacterium]REK36768.1 MAG: NADH-quinone oxidoreductase subunit D [Planctomycetota bacterium]
MATVIEDQRVIEFDVRTDEMLVNMGPQHPSTHGVLRLLLRTDGEVVHECTPHIGYLHRCAEKIGENLAGPQWIPYTDRMDYLAGMNMNLGMALAYEKLLGMELPEKAMTLRVIIAEMGRIASHLVGMGAYGLDLGSFSPFLYAFREREIILDLFEEACGARLTYSYLTIGGATHDLPATIPIPPGLAGLTENDPNMKLQWADAVRMFLDWLEPRIQEYHTLLTKNSIFINRTAGIGEMSAEMAIDYGCTGPVLRGSGVDFDLRRDGEPIYTRMYEGYDFEIPVAPFKGVEGIPPEVVLGDNWCRFYVRMLEVAQAIRLVRQALDRYPSTEGDFRVPFKMNTKLPRGESYLETECPRGQMGFFLVGDDKPEPLRARAKSSCFCNLSVTGPLCQGILLADIPAIVGSLDVVMGEIDR